MERKVARWTLGELATLLQGQLEGPADLPIDHPASAEDNDPLGIAFAESLAYMAQARSSGVGAVLIDREMDPQGLPAIRVPSPRMAFGMLLTLSVRAMPLEQGVHPTAIVHPEAAIHPDANIGPYVVVERGASVGSGAKIFPFCYIGEGCSVGADTLLCPHVTLYQDVSIGDRSLIHSGVVLGADGFGFLWDGTKRIKVPQVGRVQIGDDVEIGANTTIDRATAGVTTLEDGVKLDNLIQIGHNTKIGEHTVIAGLSGISGSTTIGKRVVMGGGVGTRDHVSIADDVHLGGRSAVGNSIEQAGEYFGVPARPAGEALRSMMLMPRLPELFSRLRALEKRLEALEGDS